MILKLTYKKNVYHLFEMLSNVISPLPNSEFIAGNINTVNFNVMLQKLIVGRYIEFGSFGANKSGQDVAGIQTMQPIIYHVAESEKVSNSVPTAPFPFNKSLPGMAKHVKEVVGIKYQNNIANRQHTSQVAQGFYQSKGHRNFMWLEFIKSKVTQIRIGSASVLTGPMSGCWITYYTHNGTRYVGHIGTSLSPTDPDTIAAKAAWNNYYGSLQNVTGFNPFNNWYGSMQDLGSLYALVTPNGEFYSVWLKPDSNRPARRLITAVQKINNFYPTSGII